MVCSLMNLVALTRLFTRIYKQEGSLYLPGAAHLTFFGVALGPGFTMIVALYLYMELFYEAQ